LREIETRKRKIDGCEEDMIPCIYGEVLIMNTPANTPIIDTIDVCMLR
jgi:hypothetical protein